jgi:hypothetical protein
VALDCGLQQTPLRRIVIDDQDRFAHIPPNLLSAFLCRKRCS